MLHWLVIKRFLPYILVILMILGMGYWIYNSGYRSGADAVTRMYEQKIQEERKRILSANLEAQEQSRKRQAELQRLLSERNDTIRLLMQEAFADPDAGNVAIGADSVRRIDRIR
jgi:Tfp pilus assembly protein PilO